MKKIGSRFDNLNPNGAAGAMSGAIQGNHNHERPKDTNGQWKKGGNMYDWITRTWDPIGGECPHGCSYCYVKSNHRPAVKKKYSGRPHLVEHEMTKSLASGHFYFVCSMMDLFAAEIPFVWISQVLERLYRFDNQYLLQTKNPARMLSFVAGGLIPTEAILGTTIETNSHYDSMGSAPGVGERAAALGNASRKHKTMVTVEPIMDFKLGELMYLILQCRPSWVNIGADSKAHKLVEPSPEKVRDLVSHLKAEGIEVKLKSNLDRILKGG